MVSNQLSIYLAVSRERKNNSDVGLLLDNPDPMAAFVSKLHVSMPTLQIGTKERKKIYQIMIIAARSQHDNYYFIMEHKSPESQLVHGPEIRGPARPLALPIYTSSTYRLESAHHGKI